MVSGGDLLVSGDHRDNSVAVEPGATAGEFVVTGLVGFDGRVTTVNGRESVVLNGVSDDVRIGLGGGNDDLTVEGGVRVPDELEIWGDAGNDLIILSDVQAGGEVELHTNSGSDSIGLEGVTFRDDVEIETGGGDDFVFIAVAAVDPFSPAIFTSDFGGEFEVELGDGNDQIAFGGSRFRDEFEVEGGDGFNTLNNLLANFFEDEVELEDFQVVGVNLPLPTG
jgi:hypothetical protein